MRDSASCSGALRQLIDRGFQQAAASLEGGAGPLAPFLISDGSEGTELFRSNQRLGVAKAVLRKHAGNLPKDVARCVIGYEQPITDGDSRILAVVMEGCERGFAQSVVFARPYARRSGTETPKLSQRLVPLAASRSLFEGRRFKWGWCAAGLACLALGIIAALIVNNNVSYLGTHRIEFENQLDRAVTSGTKWMAGKPYGSYRNPYLIPMIQDMANLSQEKRLRGIVTVYLKNTDTYATRRLVEKSADPVYLPGPRETAQQSDYERWILYAVAPDKFALTQADRADMLSPTKHRRGSLTHQLYALLALRDQGRTDESVGQLIDTVCQRIAAEAVWDFRVTDLYLQRVAFLLAAGRTDLVKRRWIERILSNQHPNGGFRHSWYGFGPGVFAHHFNKTWPNEHSTVQGVWILYMLKYRFPGWVEANFPKEVGRNKTTRNSH